MNATTFADQDQSIAPGELAALRASGHPCQLIDVRTSAEYAQVHAEGALLFPLERLAPADVLRQLASPQEPIYLLCKSGTRARMAREKFSAAGIDNVICVEGGTDAWLAAGLPVVRGGGGGAGVIALERQVRIAAGTLVLAGIVLGFFVHRGLFAVSGFVGAGLVFAGLTDTCAMGMALARMPWNQNASCRK
ncbi:MAG TPA: rhodanese-like domain-containing protein [Tepidisphaeraceae bacterium]|jgi:rhodanese-related sulfurtransferase